MWNAVRLKKVGKAVKPENAEVDGKSDLAVPLCALRSVWHEQFAAPGLLWALS